MRSEKWREKDELDAPPVVAPSGGGERDAKGKRERARQSEYMRMRGFTLGTSLIVHSDSVSVSRVASSE